MVTEQEVRNAYYAKYSKINIDLADRILRGFDIQYWRKMANSLEDKYICLSYFNLWYKTTEGDYFWRELSKTEKSNGLTPDLLAIGYGLFNIKFKPEVAIQTYEVWYNQ